jgi:hypothetical protein
VQEAWLLEFGDPDWIRNELAGYGKNLPDWALDRHDFEVLLKRHLSNQFRAAPPTKIEPVDLVKQLNEIVAKRAKHRSGVDAQADDDMGSQSGGD